MFLDDAQLAMLTGYKSRACQLAWLRDNGFNFEVTGSGKPVVLVEQVRERQCKSASATVVGPDLSWMN